MNDFEPLNDLERALQDAQARRMSARDLLRRLLASNIAVPSSSKLQADGSGFAPLIFEKDGTSMLACFSELARAREYADTAPYLVRMTGAELFRRMPAGLGLVVNPGVGVSFDLPPEGVAKVLQDLDRLQ